MATHYHITSRVDPVRRQMRFAVCVDGHYSPDMDAADASAMLTTKAGLHWIDADNALIAANEHALGRNLR